MLNSNFVAVLLDFVLYAIFVLLPLLPALIIYKKFPDTDVSVDGAPGEATGLFQRISFKAKGAFAAYVVTVMLGFFLVRNAQHHIDDYIAHSQDLAALQAQIDDLESNQRWTAQSQVKFVDADNREIQGSERSKLFELLTVSIHPPTTAKNERFVTASLPAIDETTVIQYSADGATSAWVALCDAEQVDSIKHELDLGVITLQLEDAPSYPFALDVNEAFVEEDTSDAATPPAPALSDGRP